MFKYYSCFKAKRLNYSMFDSNWKNSLISIKVYRDFKM